MQCLLLLSAVPGVPLSVSVSKTFFVEMALCVFKLSKILLLLYNGILENISRNHHWLENPSTMDLINLEEKIYYVVFVVSISERVRVKLL